VKYDAFYKEKGKDACTLHPVKHDAIYWKKRKDACNLNNMK
jgi:hypothetical protein